MVTSVDVNHSLGVKPLALPCLLPDTNIRASAVLEALYACTRRREKHLDTAANSRGITAIDEESKNKGSYISTSFSKRLAQCASLGGYVGNMRRQQAVSVLAPDVSLSRNVKLSALHTSFRGETLESVGMGSGFMYTVQYQV